MWDVKLRLINKSNDQNNTAFLIFSKNIFSGFDAMAVAWRVIQNLGRDDSHSFTYPCANAVGAEDRWGNNTRQIIAEPGQQFVMVESSSSDVLERASQNAPDNTYQIENQLPAGAINVNLYKDGKLFSTKIGVVPGQKAVFEVS